MLQADNLPPPWFLRFIPGFNWTDPNQNRALVPKGVSSGRQGTNVYARVTKAARNSMGFHALRWACDGDRVVRKASEARSAQIRDKKLRCPQCHAKPMRHSGGINRL
jgi:hypothetical protein